MQTKPAKIQKSKLKRLPKLFIILSTVPAALLTIYFTLISTIRALVLSFTNSTSLGTSYKVVGFENYTYMFKDKDFIQALFNTLKLMAVVPVVTICISLVLAFILVQTKLKEKGVYRTLYFFPSIVSMTVIGIVWSFVFHPTMGIINALLNWMGLENLSRIWLNDAGTALWCIAITLVWQAAGYYMVMHIAAMDGISPEIYEAATIDGASSFRKLVSITIPLIKDIIGITFVLSLSGTINLSYVLVQIMTGGGNPNGASSVLLGYIYKQGMLNGNFGYAMAITVFTLAISIVLSVVSRRISGSKEES
ncbi:MAG: carbohydrate ABC transporter permease [Oscillospiraceae bacterium]